MKSEFSWALFRTKRSDALDGGLMTALSKNFGQQALAHHIVFNNQRLHFVYSDITVWFTALF